MQIVDILELGKRSLLSLVQEPERCRMRLDPNVKLPAKTLQEPCCLFSLILVAFTCCRYHYLQVSSAAAMLRRTPPLHELPATSSERSLRSLEEQYVENQKVNFAHICLLGQILMPIKNVPTYASSLAQTEEIGG